MKDSISGVFGVMIVAGLLAVLTGCESVHLTKQEKFVQDGQTYQHQVVTIDTYPLCTGSCLNP